MTAYSCMTSYADLQLALDQAHRYIALLQQRIAEQQVQIRCLQAEKQAIQEKFGWCVELLAVPNKRVRSSTKLTIRRLVQDILPSATTDDDGYAVVRLAAISAGNGLSENATRTEIHNLAAWGILDTKTSGNEIRIKIKNERILANASYIGKVSPRASRQIDRPRQLTLDIVCPACGSPRLLANLSTLCADCGHLAVQRVEQEQEPLDREEPGECEQIAQTLLVKEQQQTRKAARPPAPRRACARCGTRCWTWMEDAAGGWWDCGCLLRERERT